MIQRDEYDTNGLRIAECTVCWMAWIEREGARRDHECPAPYNIETAKAIHSMAVHARIPISMRMRARMYLALKDDPNYFPPE